MTSRAVGQEGRCSYNENVLGLEYVAVKHPSTLLIQVLFFSRSQHEIQQSSGEAARSSNQKTTWEKQFIPTQYTSSTTL